MQAKTDPQPSPQFEAILAACTPEDFDGHTDFQLLTPEQRLEWLYQAATFVYEFKGQASAVSPHTDPGLPPLRPTT